MSLFNLKTSSLEKSLKRLQQSRSSSKPKQLSNGLKAKSEKLPM